MKRVFFSAGLSLNVATSVVSSVVGMSALALAVTAVSASALHASGTKTERITKEAVLTSVEANSAKWQAAIANHSPRLFFTDKDWTQVVREIAAMPASRASYQPAFFDAADRIVAAPLPEYLPPEQMVGKRGDTKTLYSAMEELWQRDVGNDIFALSVAARLKPDGPYGKKLHDLVMTAIGFETWGRNTSKMGNNADLSAGHVGRGIAVAYDWHRDLFTDAERESIRTVIAERMACLLKGLYGDAFWARGFEENHNQVSVAALGYCGIAFYNEIPGAPEWLAAARLNFQAVGEHIPADGGSVEGVSYWTYGISFILQYIEATRLITDSGDLYNLPYFKNAAGYRFMASTSGLAGNLTWGDSVPTGWSTPHAIIFRLAAQYNDADAGWFADHLPAPKGGSDDRALNLLWGRNAPVSDKSPTALDAHVTVSDLVTSRSGWASSDYMLAIKSGFTNRNHSHLDAGALALAFGDEWLLVAPGYGSGSGEGAFWQSGSTRWNYFSNATESHSTLLINGANQRFDAKARGTITQFFTAPEWNRTHIDLTQAYRDVAAASREIIHRRNDYILVFDAVTAPKSVTVETLSQFRNDPKKQDDGSLLAKGKSGSLQVSILSPDTPLALREPTVPKVDVKKGRHFTYTAKTTGTAVNFTTLLQPVPAAKNTPPLKTRVLPATSLNGPTDFEIIGDGWTDRVTHNASNEASAPIVATTTIIRSTASGIHSVLALDATAVRFPSFTWTDSRPCDIAFERIGDNAWRVTASRDIRAELKVESGVRFEFVQSTENTR